MAVESAALVQTQAGGPNGSNVLSERFLDVDELRALYETRIDELRTELYDGGTANEILEAWTTTLLDQAADLVDDATVDAEAAAIAAYF